MLRARIDHPGTPTFHDAMLLNQSLLRRDEIWFMGRGTNEETSKECLSDYKDLRYDEDVRKAYLEGRFSGVPHVKPFRRRAVRPGHLEQSEFHLNENSTEYQIPPKSSE